MYCNIWILKIRKHSIDKTWTREAVCRIYLLHEKKIFSKGKQERRKKNNSRNARKETNPNVILIKVDVNGKVTVLEFARETE